MPDLAKTIIKEVAEQFQNKQTPSPFVVSVPRFNALQEGTLGRAFTAEGCLANNGSKATPCLSADLLGDWREEVLFRSADGRELRLFTTTHATSHRLPTLMHDSQYRLSVAWQNVGYNQPPHPSFFLGETNKPDSGKRESERAGKREWGSVAADVSPPDFVFGRRSTGG